MAKDIYTRLKEYDKVTQLETELEILVVENLGSKNSVTENPIED